MRAYVEVSIEDYLMLKVLKDQAREYASQVSLGRADADD